MEVASVLETSVAYEMTTTPPFRMPSGTYRGSLTYSIGPRGDFDFGNDVTALSGSSLTVNFVLDVQHAFLFEFPPGSERAVLEPPGAGKLGWPAASHRSGSIATCHSGPGRQARSRFTSSASTMWVPSAGFATSTTTRCRYWSHSRSQGVSSTRGQVERLALPSGAQAALQFDAVTPTLNRRGQLHFDVERSQVQNMLRHPGSTYTGQVTVVFDAEL